MGLRDKFRPIYALFTTLPFGIIALMLGINGLSSKTNISHLTKFEGKTVFVGDKDIPSKGIKGLLDATVIIIAHQDKTVQCNTFVTVDRTKLKSIYGQSDKKIIVWYDPEFDNNIEQVVLENRMILEYSPPYILYLIFIFVGIVFTGVTVYYLIQQYSDIVE